MNPTDWVRIGGALPEEDAESLMQEIKAEGYPTKLKRLEDSDDGRCVVVLAQRLHAPFAREIRARIIKEETAGTTAGGGSRLGMISMITSAAGFAVGAPLGWVVRGTSLVAVMAGCAVAMCSFLVTLAFVGPKLGEASVQQRTSTQASVPGQTRRPEQGRKD